MNKIMIISNHSYMLYRFRKELITELARDHEVVLCMPFVGHQEDFMAQGLKCIDTQMDRRGINPRTDLKLFNTYRRILKEEKPDMVITYSIKPNVYGGIACELAGIPYCANVQGLGTAFQRSTLSKFVTVLYKAALGKVKTVFFENEGNAREFRSRNIIPDRKITLLNGAGINLDEYRYHTYPENDRMHFLYLGRIMQEKGIDELFDAMRRLYAETGGRVTLDLVGFFEDDYKAQVDQMVADGIATFHGFQADPRPFYGATDCVVMPSYHEGMSNVLLEAAAIGRPIITTDIHGCKEAVDHGTTGLLCRVKDSADLYAKMLEMFRLPPRDRQQMGKAGRAKMELEFSKAMVVEQTVRKIYS